MIIKRKYCTYGQLLNDAPSKKVIYDSILNCSNPLPIEEIDRILGLDANTFVFNSDLGCGIPGEAFHNIKQEFERLDKEQPFDNGLTYRDVTHVTTFPSRKGTAVMQIMYQHIMDLPSVIVQVIAFETHGTSITQVDTWDVGQVDL